MAERGRAPGPDAGICGDLAAARRRRGRAASRRRASRHGRLSSTKLREWVRAEAGAGRLLPWVPVAFGVGIALYFTADHEPVASVTAARRSCSAWRRFCCGGRRLFPLAVMIAAMAAGFATATWKTAIIAHGVLARPMYSVSLSGFVETRDIRERTDRFVLRVTQMESPRCQIKLERVRLSVRKGTAPDVGSFVELKARLQPPLAPMRPGSYDFGRDMYFQGIGASGFVTGAIKTRGAAGERRAGRCATRRSCRDCAMRSTRGSAPSLERRPARHRHRTTDRPPRCHHHAGQRRHVHFRARPRAVDLRLSHGGGRRRGVLCGPRAAGADPGADRRAFRSRNGRRPQLLPPPRSICCCPAPRSRPSARSS